MTFGTSDLIIGVVTALVGAAITLAITYINNRHGNKILVEHTNQTSEMKISPSVRKGLKILYNDVQMKDIVLDSFEISNLSNKSIEDVKIILHVGRFSSSRFSSSRFPLGNFSVFPPNDPLELTKIMVVDDPSDHKVEISRDYLNSKKAYKKEVVRILILSERKLSYSASGGGKDWTVEYQDISTKEKKDTGKFLLLSLSLLLSAIWITLPFFAFTALESWVKIAIAITPTLGIFIWILVSAIRSTRK